jgi:hypothetical protein
MRAALQKYVNLLSASLHSGSIDRGQSFLTFTDIFVRRVLGEIRG